MKSSNSEYDLIIKGGTVYDGTLSEPFTADVGINGDKIAFVGDIQGAAARTVDAADLAVTPGFIDVHTHCDLTFSPLADRLGRIESLPGVKGNHNYLFQGVTTVVTGNCGNGFADMDAWFDLLKSVEFGSNVFHLAPHGTIRQEMFGENQPGELNQQQMEAMKNRVREEMEKGAVGFSTGLEYAPGLQASIGELVELNKVVREYGRIYTTHMRTESGAADADGVTGFENSFRETMAVVRQAEVPVEISHLKITAPINDQKASLVLDLIEKARTEGLKVTADQYPYDAGSTNLAIFLPAHFKSDTGIKNELKTREGRVQIKKAIEAVFSHLGPEKLLLTMYPEKRFYEGKTVAEISEMEGKSPTDVYADMVCEKRAPIGVFFTQDMDIVRELMPNDFVITGSDGWTVPKGLTVPHPRTYGTFPRKIEKFALKEQLISLVQAIHSMTGLPAETFNMKGRGKIAAGNYADVAVIDIDAIADRSTYLDPHHYAEGVVHLLVNGRFGIENGKDTGIEAGKALRM